MGAKSFKSSQRVNNMLHFIIEQKKRKLKLLRIQNV